MDLKKTSGSCGGHPENHDQSHVSISCTMVSQFHSNAGAGTTFVFWNNICLLSFVVSGNFVLYYACRDIFYENYFVV